MGVSKEEEPLVNALVHNGVGSPADQLPQHEVTITRPFYMGLYTVTQEQYQQVIGKNPSKNKNARFPAGTVNWDDAAGFARKLSEKTGMTARLPTEAEWEYACRAGTTMPFYTGETINTDQANYDGSVTPFGKGVKGVYRNKMLPVGSFKPNPWGLYDMVGNAQQWVADWYAADYYGKSPAADPKGPDSGSFRVLRGATYSYGPRHCRSAYRDHLKASVQGDVISFRVVVECQ
jgi:formylglycine-generating enzyme required for sulfatase activity